MKRCPKCGSEAELINGVEYYAAQTGAFASGFGAGIVASLFLRNHGAYVGDAVMKNLTENTHKKYRCTSPVCKHVWEEYK